MPALSRVEDSPDNEVRCKHDRQPADDETVDENGNITTDAVEPVRANGSGGWRNGQSEKAEPQEKLRKCQHDHAPQDPFCEAAADREGRSAFQPQSDTGENEAQQRHRRQQLDQKTNDVRQHLWSGHTISLGLEGRGHVIRRERYPEYGAREFLDYETPPTPCRTQNSSNRVTPDTASSMAEASSHRPKVRPDIKATTAPKTAPPAPTGATTLPIQLMKLKNAPSGCAPV